MPKVVVIDDSESSLQYMAHTLGAISGCEAITFPDSAAGLKWCLHHDVDLIVVDYIMPKPDGLEFIETFRRERPTAPAVPIIMVTSSELKDIRYMALQIGATDFLSKPLDPIEFMARTRNLLNLHRTEKALTDRAQWLADQVHDATLQLVEREREALLLMGRAAEHRDPAAGGHLARMARYAALIAEGMELPADTVDAIFAAAPLHDVGKIAIPDSILLKPGPLDADEFEQMKRHTSYGHEILSAGSSPLLTLAAEIALCHHEHYDGTGYPHRLMGDAIPLVGRIVALADVFDALTSARPYKESWSIAAAADYVAASKGTHFDPACVEALLKSLDLVHEIQQTHRLAFERTTVS